MVSETHDAIPRLSQWLIKNGYKIYFNQKKLGPYFSVSGTSTRKPDLIAISPKGIVLAIEVKSGESGYDLGSNSKIIIYYKNYNENKTLYYDDDKKLINIDYFVIASYYSPEGRLNSVEPFHIEKSDSKRRYLWINGFEPKKEYEATFTILRRGIWDQIKPYHDRYKNKKTGIGALLSTALDDTSDEPAIFVKKPGPNIWCHRWYKQI